MCLLCDINDAIGDAIDHAPPLTEVPQTPDEMASWLVERGEQLALKLAECRNEAESYEAANLFAGDLFLAVSQCGPLFWHKAVALRARIAGSN